MKIAILINYKDVGKKATGKKHFAAGSVEHEPFRNIEQLGNIIASVGDQPKECISIGTFPGDGKVTFKNDNHYSRRAKDMLPGNIMVIDNDTEQPYDVNIFSKYWDTFKGAGYIQSKSGSTLAGSKEHGSHTYFIYKGEDLKKAMLFLEAICIIEGYYVVDFHKTGRAVVKTPIDIKLNEVQMPVYEDDINPVVVDGAAINIDVYPDNYDHLMSKAEKITTELLKDAQDESIKRHKVYLEEYQGVTKLNNEELLISLNDYESHEIDENVILYSNGAEVGTVGDLLLGVIKTNLFADIHEPDYGGGSQKARFYGSMFHSQAHGGIKYYIKVSYSWYQEHKDKLLHDVSVKKQELTDMIHADMSDDEIAELLDQTEGAVEKSNIIKNIKKVTGLTKEEIRDAYNRSLVQDETSLSKYFKGASIFWDGNLGVFVEYHKRGDIRLHKKSNFEQTLMSATGLEHKDVKTILPQIPLRYMEYNPTIDGNSTAEHINVWIGVRYPKKVVTNIPPTINKLLRNLFIDDFKAKEVFINWMATIVQTGVRTGIAWGFFGEQGTGKGIICDVMRDLVGRRNSSMNVSDTQLQSAFNGYAKNVQFIHLNEVASDFHGRHGVAGKLKALVTDSVLQINEKSINEIEVDNYANIILNSNKPNPIELDVGDRRWNMINTTKPLSQCSWFKLGETPKKIMDEVKDFGCYLMDYDIDKYAASRPMELSAAKKSISDQTTSPYKLLGDAIKKGDLYTLCDMLNPEDDLSNITVSELEVSISENFWSSNLLKAMYSHVSSKQDPSGVAVSNHFIKPYITNKGSYTKKLNSKVIRGYSAK